MEKFITSIKKKYRERILHHERQWPLCLSSKIINLLLVNRKANEGYFGCQQRGRPVETKRNFLADYSELFEVESGKKPVRKVLIEGDAGIGKTTLCLSLSEDWANGKIFQQFELLLFLPLRHRIVRSAGSLLELLKLLHSSTQLCEDVACYLEEEEGEKVLIIADGWDELDKSGRQEGSFLHSLLFDNFPFASVILTSRPSASSSLHELRCIDQFVEIHGFSGIKSLEYIQSEFADDEGKARRLLKKMSTTPFVKSICSVPLNCVILCHLWRACEEALPTTMTGLYTKIILNIILHNLRKTETYKVVKSLAGFDALPDDLVESWWLLCEFAYHAMEEDQIVFSREKLIKFFSHGLALDEKVLCFGLLQVAEPILETGYGVSFHFLHLIFQEYLAALHIMKQPLDKQLEIINLKPMFFDDIFRMYEHKCRLNAYGVKLFSNTLDRSKRFSIVWQFFCGICFCKSNEKEQYYVEQLVESLSTMINDTLVMFREGWLHLCHFAFEARHVIVSQKVIKFLQKAFRRLNSDPRTHKQSSSPGKVIVPGTLTLGRAYLSTYDCIAIVYLISNIQETTNLNLDFSYCGIEDDTIRALTDALVGSSGMLQIQTLNLNGNKLADTSLSDLFSRASLAFKSLQVLKISDNQISTESLNSIAAPADKFSFRKLLMLDLSLNPLGVSGVKALNKAVRSGALANLVCLNLQGALTDDVRINSDLLTTFAFFCHQLYNINLSHNNLGFLGTVALTEIICKSQTFDLCCKAVSKPREAKVLCGPLSPFTINVSATNLDLEAFVLYLLLQLENQSVYFDLLDLRDNSIPMPHLSSLFLAICSHKFVIRGNLYLGDNHLGPNEAYTIGVILSNFNVTTLNLSQCQLTVSEVSNDVVRVGQQLCQLPQTSSLISLNLDGNSLTGEGIYILAGFMHLCPCLKFVSCVNCQITSEDLLQLFGKCSSPSQQSCKELIGWNLYQNRIDDRGFAALLEHLPSLFPRLGCNCDNIPHFVFDGNPVSAEMIKRVNCEISHRNNMSMLFNCQLAKPGFAVFSLYSPNQLQNMDYQPGMVNLKMLMESAATVPDATTDTKTPSVSIITPSVYQSTDVTTLSTSTCNLSKLELKPDIHILRAEVPIYSCSPSDCGTSAIPKFNILIVKSIVESPNTHNSEDPEVCRHLTVSDLASIQRAVWEGRAKWYNIGLELGLTAGTLDAILLDNPHHSGHCFTATLKEWLSRADLQPSLDSLANALRALPVGLGDLAEALSNLKL